MAAATLDRDVQQLKRWLQRVADLRQASLAGTPLPAMPGDGGLPELTGPLKILLSRLAVLLVALRAPSNERRTARRLATLLEMTEELEQRCVHLERAHARLRAVPAESAMVESLVDTARLCQIDYDVHVAEATLQVYVLINELGPRTPATLKRVNDQQRRAAQLHLQRLELIADPALYPAGVVPQTILDQREMWTKAIGSGHRVLRKEPSPHEVATDWLDKSADLVVLYTMIQERGHTDPLAWFHEADVQPPRILGVQNDDGELEEVEGWDQRLLWLQELGRRRLLFTAGSTHPGEDRLLAEAFHEARGDRRDATLMLVPRHWDTRGVDGEALHDAVHRAAGILGEVRLLSELRPGEDPDAIIVTCTGLLRALYGVGHGAFVGGTLSAAMGHNVCEPLVWGIPTWTGPNHHANIIEWEEVQTAMDPHLRTVEASGLTAMFSEWFDQVDTGTMERNRPVVKAALDDYLRGLADQSVARVRGVPRAVWRCASVVKTKHCPDCDGSPRACAHWKDLQRYRMADERRVRWFIPRFARFILDRTDE